jgi:transposase
VAAGTGVLVACRHGGGVLLSESHHPAAPTYAVFCGVDVGKSDHHACAVNPDGTKLHDKALPNDEAALTTVLSELMAHGRVLVIIDQPASIGALTIAVARKLGIDIAYLPGLAMRRIADLHPGEGKTDGRDAYIIADAARTLPHALRRVGTDDETLAGLSVLVGYDDDLAAQSTRLSNRLRDALLHVHPALERLLGKHIERGGVIDLLAACPTPAALRALGEEGIRAVMATRSPRLAKTLPATILAALDAQTVVVPGTPEFGRVIAGVATQLRQVRTERTALAIDVEARLATHPLAEVLTSMPGLGVRTALMILTIVGDGAAFPSRAPRGLRRNCPRNPPLRLVHQRRDPLPARQPRPHLRPVLIGLRQSRRPHQSHLLRQETSSRQTAQRGPHLPRPPPRRRPVRHAPRPQALPTTRHHLTHPDALAA